MPEKLGWGGRGGERLNLWLATHRMNDCDPGQDQRHNCGVPGRIKTWGLLFKMSSQGQESIRPSVGPSKCGALPVCLHRSHTHEPALTLGKLADFFLPYFLNGKRLGNN